MLSFESDYTTGAHPYVLQRLLDTNLESQPGYGNDTYCASARERIRAACACPEADVRFLVGGTQTNSTVIAMALMPYEGVISATTGHIAAHEAGAVEYTGHKVLTIPGHNGKIRADELTDYLVTFYADGSHDHMVQPGMVYISHPTEYGTLYTLAELEEIAAVCRSYRLPLFLDGARLGYGLASLSTDVTLPDIARLCDIFYIGGTKVGALCGEAIVYTKRNTPACFVAQIKQHGALLAKGRLLGIQFDVLFTDDLYFRISRHAIDMAERLKEILTRKGYRFFLDSPTNQQFVIVDNDTLASWQGRLAVSFWEKYDDTHTVVRFATSWSTTQEDLKKLEKLL